MGDRAYRDGERSFDEPFAHTNGRSCATCPRAQRAHDVTARPRRDPEDPGRAAITGNPLDFEAIDVPQLRGIAHTAPYFHDNSAGTLADVVDSYRRFVLGALPPLNLPAINPPETPFTPPEALSPAQKQVLLALLQRL